MLFFIFDALKATATLVTILGLCIAFFKVENDHHHNTEAARVIGFGG